MNRMSTRSLWSLVGAALWASGCADVLGFKDFSKSDELGSSGGSASASGGATDNSSDNATTATGSTGGGAASSGAAGSSSLGQTPGNSSGTSTSASTSTSGGSNGGASTSSMQSSSSSSAAPCVPPTTGTAGFATRYWDCCKPSCGSSHTCEADGVTRNDGAQDACQGGSAYECYDMAPQVVSPTLAYAFAAFDGAACGTCYQLTFTGTSNTGNVDTGSQQICGSSIIVEVINTGGLGQGQFDLLIPGGGVGANDACATEWSVPTSELGVQFGGLMSQCEQSDDYDYSEYTACTISACQSLFANSSTMEAGCEFIINWMKGANNPNLMYTQVTCPSQLTSVSGI